MKFRKFTPLLMMIVIASSSLFAQTVDPSVDGANAIIDISNSRSYVALKVPSGQSITIDGSATEAIWSNAAVKVAPQDTFIINRTSTVLSFPFASYDCASNFKVVWDNDYLYIFLNVKDDNLIGTPKETQPWQADNVELFFNADPSKGVTENLWSQVRYNIFANDPSKVLFSGGGYAFTNVESVHTGVSYAWVGTPFVGYTLEGRIPWSMVIPNPTTLMHPFKVEQGAFLGFDVQTGDADDATKTRPREHIASWNSRFVNTTQDMAALGTLFLGGEDGSISTGVKAVELQTKVNVYPTSFNSFINIDIENVNAIASISIVNSLGQIVKTISKIQNKNKVEVGNLVNGMYFVYVKGDNNSSKTIKLIKK